MSTSALLHLVVSHLLSIVSFVFAILLVARAGSQRRPTGSTMAWALAVILVPYVGVPLFLLLGGRKVGRLAGSKHKLLVAPRPPRVDPNDSPLARMLCGGGAAPPTNANRFELLSTGEISYEAVASAIRSATKTIAISTLIFANDETGQLLADLLVERAKAGVEVRLMIDALFEFRSSRAQMRALKEAGVKVAWFMPIGRVSRRGSANLRLHRKAILIDDREAIVGGMNLAKEYMGPTPMPGRWRDLSALVRGPAVRDIASIFRADWAFASGETIPEPASPPETPEPGTGNAEIQVVGSGPDSESDLIYDAFLTAIFKAERRLWLATPYFVPDEALVRAIALAVRRGVDVCIIVPKKSNHLTADLAGAEYLRELEKVGARVRGYAPGMLHAKLVLVDDDLAVLGSANMDMRSFFLDYEIALFVASKVEVAAMRTWFEHLLPDCVVLEEPGRARKLVESIARLLAPLE